jgi:hypothetical protein
MVRHEHFKYCPNAKQPEALLFDLAADPAESVNLADDPDYTEVRRNLADLLAHRVAEPPLEGVTGGATEGRRESSPDAVSGEPAPSHPGPVH